MIADRMWRAGLKRWFQGLPVPRVIQVPFQVGLYNDGNEVGIAWLTDEHTRLMPKGDDYGLVRPPYPTLILTQGPQSRSALAFRAVDGGDGLWWYVDGRPRQHQGRIWEAMAVTLWSEAIDCEHTADLLLGYSAFAENHDNGPAIHEIETVNEWVDCQADRAVEMYPGDDEMRALYAGFAAKMATGEPKVGQVIFGHLFAACALLNCRNISQVEVKPSRAERRRAERNGDLPPFSYHVLRVAPMADVRRRERGERVDPMHHVALHWTRGHFKTFTQEKPLFGKITGRFWWQPHLGGRDRTRFVDKDYDVTARQDAR